MLTTTTQAELAPHATLSDACQRAIYDALAQVTAHPFTDFAAFEAQLRELAELPLPAELEDIIAMAKHRDIRRKPYFYIANCPVDRELPILDWENPRADKLKKKQTFIAEGFLVLYSILLETPTLAYRFGGNGDYIRDVHASRALQNSHTSQTLTSFGFHKELPIRPTSPDYLRLMGLRSSPHNDIRTTFVINQELIDALDAATLDVLRQPLFHTPFTVLSVNVDKENVLGTPPAEHPILQEVELFYHEGRTEALTPEAQSAMERLNAALVHLKQGIAMHRGDFVDFANKYCLHAKDVVRVGDPEGLKNRWLIKTFNAQDLRTYEPYFVPGHYGLVNG